MPVPGIKGLFPEFVNYKGVRHVLLEDRHVFDTVTVAVADRTAQFFITLAGKEPSEANFRGDQSLVREENVFVPIQISIFPRVRILTDEEGLSFWNRGHIIFQITSPQKIAVLEDNLRNVSPAVGWNRVADASAGPVNEIQPHGRTFMDRRCILIPENKIVKGGRNVNLTLNWTEPEGNGLLVPTEVTVEFYGGEYEAG